MSRAEKKRRAQTLTAQESAYTLRPWSCNHYPNFSEIEAYLPITGDFEIIADVHDSKGVDAEVVAVLITRAVNSYDKNRDTIEQMAAAIELCLGCRERLSWEAEHEAQTILNRARNSTGED